MRPPASPSASPSGPPPSSSQQRLRRRLAAGALLAGGVLAGIAPFLPWVRTDYPALEGEPASTILRIPAAGVGNLVAHPGVETIFFLFGFWGVPAALAALGLVALWRRGAPRPRARIGGLLLVALGTGWTLFQTVLLLSLAGAFSSVPHTNTLAYGPGVALLGYLCALMGSLWAPFLARSSRG